jgi:S1-C subfamily serine protease
MANSNQELQAISDSMAEAVERGGQSTVLVNARRRFPASGIVIEKDLVLTASHVVEIESEIQIQLADGSQREASLLGRDAQSDLALLKLDKATDEVAELAKDEAKIGQLALALGRPTENGVQASLGIVSARLGPMQMMHGGFMEAHLRTDASPFPGFSGGPLIDSQGKVLGINTSGIGRGRSVTIPAAKAWQIAEALKDGGSVKRGFLGIRGQIVEIDEDSQKLIKSSQASGILVVELEKDSPAAESQLKVSDIVVGFNGEAVENHERLMAQLNTNVVGKKSQVNVLRGEKLVSVDVTVGERSYEEPRRRRGHRRGHGFGHRNMWRSRRHWGQR